MSRLGERGRTTFRESGLAMARLEEPAYTLELARCARFGQTGRAPGVLPMSLFALLLAGHRRRRGALGKAGIPPASGAGRRSAALAPGFVALLVASLLLPAPAARAQRLLTLVPGVAQAASAGDPGSMGPAPVAVEVDLDLLRSGPWRLEAPTPDGSVLVAERSVFEDRGGGDLMWSGGQPGAGYDTVVLTVEGGRFVGRFGAAGGGAYQIHAERDGSGGMAPIVGARPEGWCGVDSAEEGAHDGHVHSRAAALAAEPPRRVSNPQSHDRLDILVAYTATAARNWADRGGPEAAIRHAGDYMKMVFRNNDLGVEPHIVHIVEAPARLDRLGQHAPRIPTLFNDSSADAELRYLRRKHRADFVHVFSGDGPALLGPCGQHALLSKVQGTAQEFSGSAWGWTTNHAVCADYAATFVHEIGHGLGANHPFVSAAALKRAFKPYALGHQDFDAAPPLRTAMDSGGMTEPFFSTPRINLFGAVAGIAHERDNERLLRETVTVGARYSDYLAPVDGVPAPPSDLRVWRDGDSARLSWQDNAPDADGYEVWRHVKYRLFTDEYESFGPFLLRPEGRTAATVPLEQLRPYTIHLFSVYQPGVKVGFLACVRRLVDARSALRQAHEAMASSGLDGFVATSFGYCLQKAASSLRAASM